MITRILTPAQVDHWNALRDYQQAHRVWMDTPVHTKAGERAKAVKNEARDRYEKAYRAVYPTHILL